MNSSIENFLISLEQEGLIAVSGSDAEKFLQGQLTCDVREVNEQQFRLGALCNHQGRVLAVFLLFRYQDTFYLQLPTTILEQTLTHLKKFAVFSKVELRDASAQLMRFIVFGPTAENTLKALSPYLPSNPLHSLIYNSYGILRLPIKLPCFEIVAGIENKEYVLKQLELTPIASSLWDLLKIRVGIPTIYPKTIGEYTPHMLNLLKLQAVSFDKGCYVGQEIVARTHYLGKSKRELFRGKTHTEIIPQPSDKLFNAAKQEIGSIVTATSTSEGEYEFLAVLSLDHIREDIYFQNTKITLFDFEN